MTKPMRTLAATFPQAAAAFERGRFAEAESICLAILDVHEKHFDAVNLLAITQFLRGSHIEALASFERALAIRPSDPDTICNRGKALKNLGRFEEALASYDEALTIRPHDHEALHQRGLILKEFQRFEAALACFDGVLAIQPDDADALNIRGNLLKALKRVEDAVVNYDRAVAVRPDFAEPLNNRSVVLQELDRTEEALASCDAALALRPDQPDAFNNRGVLLRELNRFEDALASYDRALALANDYAEAHYNRGNALAATNRLEEALASYNRAIALKNDYANARFNKSLCLLIQGDFADGWREYEWRWKSDYMMSAAREFTKPLWLGNDGLCGRTILLHSEQGLGDTIQFCRYAKLVAQQGARVLLEVPFELKSLLRSLGGSVEVFARGEAIPEFDYNCPLMSLPLAFKTTLATIPAGRSYLRAPKAKIAMWRDRLGNALRLRVGLAWAGNPQLGIRDRERSLDLDNLAPLFEMAGCDFYSLQKGPAANQLLRGPWRRRVIDFTGDLHDFAETAALIDNLDLVIAADTSVAHLAGAMGKPFWLLNRFNSCWRWLLDCEESPWYPSAKIFRQPSHGDWRFVIERVAAALRLLNETHRERSANSRGNIAGDTAIPGTRPAARGAITAALAAYKRGDLAEAARQCAEMVAGEDRFEARYLLAVTQSRIGPHVEALSNYDRAIAIRPRHAEAHNNRGFLLHDMNRLDEALASVELSLSLDPQAPLAWLNHGVTLQSLGRFAEAFVSFERAQALKPDLAQAHHNEALCRLLLGDFSCGFAKNEWRWETDAFRHLRRNFAQPLWRGENIAGCTILVHAEQGLGDTVQFCRYVNMVAQRGATVLLEVQPELKRLLSGMDGTSAVISRGEPLPAFDFHCPLLGLPLTFTTTPDTIPRLGVLPPIAPDCVEAWNAKLARHRHPGRPCVGIAWSGNPSHGNDRNRSIPLAAMTPLFGLPIDIVSLQKDVREGDRDFLRRNVDSIAHFGEHLTDFLETAALVSLMDLVVCVDTSVAHLACALSRPTFILLPTVPDWRWSLDRDDSPWYPMAQLFRQRRRGDWNEPIERAADKIWQSRFVRSDHRTSLNRA